VSFVSETTPNSIYTLYKVGWFMSYQGWPGTIRVWL